MRAGSLLTVPAAIPFRVKGFEGCTVERVRRKLRRTRLRIHSSRSNKKGTVSIQGFPFVRQPLGKVASDLDSSGEIPVEDVHDLFGGFRDIGARAEDGLRAMFLQEVVVLRGDDAAAEDEDVGAALLI